MPPPICALACTQADKYCVPAVENTNVDRSVGLIHLTLTRCGLDPDLRPCD